MADKQVETLLRRVIALERDARDKDDRIRALRFRNGVDLSSADREMLTAERARELIGAPKKAAEAVRLCSKSFGEEAAAVAAEALREMDKVVLADCSDIIAGRPEAEALEVLKTVCGALPAATLQMLDLSENALGEKGIRALEPVLRQLNALQEIMFHNNGLSELSVQLLAQYLPVDELKLLHFHNNMSGSGGAVAAADIVARCTKLEDVRMSSSRVRADGGAPLLRSICERGATLRRINLSDSMFDEECTALLAEGLPKMPQLTDLVLRDTGLEKDALIGALADPAVVPLLSVLDLSGLELDESSAAQVGSLLATRKRLRKLWLDDNEFESPAVLAFCRAATNAASPSMIELLSLRRSMVGQIGAVALTRFAVAHPWMTSLELDENQIGEPGVAKMKALLDAAGRASVLGSLEENMADCDEDAADFDSGVAGQDSDQLDALAATLEGMSV